jgi:hypothetical protein
MSSICCVFWVSRQTVSLAFIVSALYLSSFFSLVTSDNQVKPVQNATSAMGKHVSVKLQVHCTPSQYTCHFSPLKFSQNTCPQHSHFPTQLSLFPIHLYVSLSSLFSVHPPFSLLKSHA